MSIKAQVIVHDEIVRAKLLAAAPRILAQNRVLVQAMLDPVAAVVQSDTPLGPAHFGYHGRDTVKVDVSSKGVTTAGKVIGAAQLYWREYGTRGRFRKGSKLERYVRALESGGSGERAFMPANKALSYTKRLISFYYNGMANWWRS